MNGAPTLFTNDSGASSGAIDYVKDVFQDATLPPNDNSGLTSTAATNPLGDFFGNDDQARYSAKTLQIKTIELISDRSKWISNKPTYRIIWNEDFPAAHAYVFGDVLVDSKFNQSYVQFKAVGDGIGVGGVIRKIAFLVEDSTAATATAQIQVDGVNSGSPIDFSLLAANSEDINYSRFSAFVHSTSNETKDLHDYRLISIQANTLRVNGAIVYYEDAGNDIEVFPGTTYVDKSKVTTTVGATLAPATYGSSMGGVNLVYKNSTTGYADSALSATTVLSSAQGLSGTNLVTVTTGQGASFPAGSGIVIAQGTSMYVGSVLSVSTDTLTVSPTLAFGISNSIYRSWRAGSTLSINASLMQLSHTIDFTQLTSLTTAILDPQGKFAAFYSNVGVTTVDGLQSALFLGASGYLQTDGYFSAAEIETVGSAIFHATLSVNGTPGWSANAAQVGILRRTVFTDAGPGWNSFVFGPGASLGDVGIAKINLYTRQRDLGITFGALASIDTPQAYTERPAQNATLMALGLARRTYADQLFLQGFWVRGSTITVPGNATYYGASTNSVLKFQYYGKNFAIIGTAGGGTLAVDGVGIGLSFNIMRTVASEGFHTVQYTVGSGATALIHAVDFARATGEVKSLTNNFDEFTDLDTSPVVSSVKLVDTAGFGAVNTQVGTYVDAIVMGKGLSVVQDANAGDSIIVNEDGVYSIYLQAQNNTLGVATSVYKNSIVNVGPLDPNCLLEFEVSRVNTVLSTSNVVFLTAGTILRHIGGGSEANGVLAVTQISKTGG